MGSCVLMFLEPFNVAVGGFTVQFPNGESHRIYLADPITVQDLGAHKALFHFTAGHKFCMKCLNSYARDSGLVDDDSGDGIIQCDLDRHTQMDLASDDDIFYAIDRLRERRPLDAPDEWSRRQTALGFTFHASNFLYLAQIRAFMKPVGSFMHDWMHVLLVQGCVNVALFDILESFRSVGETYAVMHAYMQQFTWPLRSKAAKPDVFSKKRSDNYRKALRPNARRQVKMQASEALQIMPVVLLRVMLVILPSGACADACAVFLALMALLELLQAIPFGKVTHAALLEAAEKFLAEYKRVYGVVNMSHKFHACLHLADEMRECAGILLSCWVHERKHKLVKEFAGFHRMLRKYCAATLSESVCKQLAYLRRPRAFGCALGLVSSARCPPKLREYLLDMLRLDANTEVVYGSVARHLKWGTSSRKDVVLVAGAALNSTVPFAGEVLAHFELNGVPVTLLDLWHAKEYRGASGYAVWNRIRNLQFVETEFVLEPLIYKLSESGHEVMTFITSRFR